MWRPAPDNSKRSNYFRFERNERTTLFTEKEFKEIISSITAYDLVAYGELEPFYKKLADWLKIDRTSILLTSGSDAGIKAIYESYVSKNDKIIITLPNYAMFSVYAEMFGAKIVHYYYEKDLSLNTNGLIELLDTNTKMVVISNPGHTGSIVPEKKLIDIIKTAGEKTHERATT